MTATADITKPTQALVPEGAGLLETTNQWNVSAGVETRTEDAAKAGWRRSISPNVIPPIGWSYRRALAGAPPGFYGRGRRAMSRGETLKSTSTCLFGRFLPPGCQP